MVRNGHTCSVNLFPKWLLSNITYGTKWFLVMVRNCNFVVRNGKLWYEMTSFGNYMSYLLTLPLCTGVSRVRALSPAWTGSPPNKKIKYNKILTYILRSIFLEIPHLELLR